MLLFTHYAAIRAARNAVSYPQRHADRADHAARWAVSYPLHSGRTDGPRVSTCSPTYDLACRVRRHTVATLALELLGYDPIAVSYVTADIPDTQSLAAWVSDAVAQLRANPYVSTNY